MNKVLENLHAYIEMARDEQNQSDNSSVRVRDKCIVDLATEVGRLQWIVDCDREVSSLRQSAYKRAAAQWQAERGDTAVFPDLAELLVWDAERQTDAALGRAVRALPEGRMLWHSEEPDVRGAWSQLAVEGDNPSDWRELCQKFTPGEALAKEVTK